jgi:DNA-binding FadR family transcriptional regulator
MDRKAPSTLQTVSQEITGKLTRRIVNNHYPVGAKLPTERSLALEFGVTRHVVREALKRLEAVGLVRIRQGSGIYVESMQLTGGIEMFDVLLTRDDGSVNVPLLQDVAEFRSHMVRLIARLAASRRTPEEMVEIRKAFLERRLDKDNPARLEGANLRLFQLIAQATHNRVYQLLFNTLGRVYLKLRAVLDIPLMGFEHTEIVMERLLDAFEQQDGEMAELLVTRYLDAIQQNLTVRQSAVSGDT